LGRVLCPRDLIVSIAMLTGFLHRHACTTNQGDRFLIEFEKFTIKNLSP